MITDRSRGVQLLVLLCQCMLVTVAFWSWFFLSYYLPIDQAAITRHLVYFEFVLLGLVIGYWRSPVTLRLHAPNIEETSRRSIAQVAATLFFLLIYLVAAHDQRISRVFFFTFIPVLYVVLFLGNRYLPTLIGRLIFSKNLKQKILLVGPWKKALTVKSWITNTEHLGFEILGLLTDDQPDSPAPATPVPATSHLRHPTCGPSAPNPRLSQAHAPVAATQSSVPCYQATAALAIAAPSATSVLDSVLSGLRPQPSVPTAPTSELHAPRSALPAPGCAPLPILGRIEDLENYLSSPGLVKVVMCEFPRTNGSMRRYTRLCESRGIRLLVVADLDEVFGRPVAAFEDDGMFFLGLREEPLQDPVNRFLKRCLDIAVSFPVCVFILPPLTLFVWLCHRLQSPGPLMFVQPREGLLNKQFGILKYRTMHVGDPSNNKLPSADDPRLFSVGAFLRKTSLDEMPQFLNVLFGDMSVVGPRPHLPSYNQQYHQIYYPAYVRSFVKPGITGLAQARGYRGNAETDEAVIHRMKSDIEYLENWSFGLDCWLILRTALQIVFPPKGAV